MAPEPSDAQLIARMAAGDEEALNELYGRYCRPLFNYLLRLLRETTAAEDMLQEAFLAAWKNAAGFRGEAQPRTWLFQIAHNQAVTWLRSNLRVEWVAVDENEPERTDIENLAHENWRADRMNAALESLPPAQRAVVELAFYQDMSYPEIAKVIGCPVGTVKSRMKLAKRVLVRKLTGPALDSIGEELV